MALVLQSISHNEICDRSEDECEQNQDANDMHKARLLIHVHKFITVLFGCTIFLAVLNSNIAKKLIGIRISAVV